MHAIKDKGWPSRVGQTRLGDAGGAPPIYDRLATLDFATEIAGRNSGAANAKTSRTGPRFLPGGRRLCTTAQMPMLSTTSTSRPINAFFMVQWVNNVSPRKQRLNA